MKISSYYSQHLFALLISIIATFYIFDGTLTGKVIANCKHIFNFEPWVHYYSKLTPDETENHVLSDSMDGSDANLNPTNIEHFSIGRHLQISYLYTKILSAYLPHYRVTTIECLILFIAMMFFLYLYFRKIGINWLVSTAVALGFTFGSTNMHLHIGWAYETACAVVTLYFAERLLQSNKWIDVLWLTLAMLNLGGRNMVHIVTFYCIILLTYVLIRIATNPNQNFKLFIKFSVAGLISLILSLDYLWPTIYHYTNTFESGYREKFGFRQNKWETIYTFIFANLYGHPRSEAQYWIHGTYINTGMFVGSLTFLSAITAGIYRAVSKKDFYSIFFLITTIFGFLYVYNFPFEKIEALVATMPILKLAPASYFKSVLHLLVTILGALGLQTIYEAARTKNNKLILIFVIIMLAIFYHALGHWNDIISANIKFSEYLNSYKPKATILLLLGIAWIILLSLQNLIKIESKIYNSFLSILLLLIVGYEAKTHTNYWTPYAYIKNCFPPTETTNFLKSNIGSSRIVGLEFAAVPSIISKETYGIETAAGRMSVNLPYKLLLQQADPDAYARHPTQHLFARFTNLNNQVWDLADVKYFVAPKAYKYRKILKRYSKGSLIPFVLNDSIILERIPNPQHAYAVYNAKIFKSPEDMANAVKQGLIVRENIVLESENDLLSESSEKVMSNSNFQTYVKNFSKATNYMEIDVNLAKPGYVYFSELYNPNWKVYSNNKQLKTFRSYFFLLGVQVPQGEHKLVIKYELKYQKLMNWIVAIALLLATLIIVRMFINNRTNVV